MRKLEEIYGDLYSFAKRQDSHELNSLVLEIKKLILAEDEKKAAKEWVKGFGDLRYDEGKTLTAEVYRNKNYPGIMIHRSISREGRWLPGWSIGHEMSGLRIGPGGYPNLHKAVKEFLEHASKVDWNRSAEKLIKDPAAIKASRVLNTAK